MRVLLLDETSLTVSFYRRIKPYEADIFSRKVNVYYCFETGLAYKSRRFEEPLPKQQYNNSPLKTGRAPLGL